MATKKQVKTAARKVVRQATRFQTPKEGGDLVKAVTTKGNDRRLRQRAVGQVRREFGKAAAVRERKALRTLDRATAANPVKRTAARRAARATQAKLVKKYGL